MTKMISRRANDQSHAAKYVKTIVTSAAMSALLVCYAGEVSAGCVTTGDIATCTGGDASITDGIHSGSDFLVPPVSFLNINNLTADINAGGIDAVHIHAFANSPYDENTTHDLTVTIDTGAFQMISESHGVVVFSPLHSDITIHNSGIITTGGMGLFISSSRGDTLINNSGTITTSGVRAYGIYGAANGDVTINNSGFITASGDKADGIYIQGSYFFGGSDLIVNITGGTVQGGTGDGGGVHFIKGATNSLNVSSGATVFALSGNAVIGDTGDETINNSGTITGNVDLGAGTNSFNNLEGGLFNSGTIVSLGAANTLTNAGTLSPGGADAVQTTAITGNLVQSSSGVVAVDINQGAAQETDIITVTGTANLAGVVVPNIINLAPGTNAEFQIITATAGITDSGLTAQDTVGFDFDVAFRGNDVYLVVGEGINSIIGILQGKGTADQRALSKHLDAIIAAGGSDSLQTLFNALRLQANGSDLINALNRLLPHAQVAQINTLLSSNQSFGNALLSCKVRDGSYAITREGECSWARISIRKMERDIGTDNPGIDENGYGFAGGFQFALQDQWRLGFAAGYETSSAKQKDAAQSLGKTDGKRAQLGAVLKNQWGPVNMYASLTSNWGWYDTERYVNLSGVGTIATSTQKIFSSVSRTRFSYLFEQGNGFYLKPMVDFSATYLHLSGYSERGAAGANLSVDSNSAWLLSATPALEIGGEFKNENDTIFRPYIRAGLTVFNKDNININASFSDAPASVAPFTVGNTFDKIFGEVEAGLHVLTTEGFNLKLSYEGRFSEDSRQHIGSIKLGIKF